MSALTSEQAQAITEIVKQVVTPLITPITQSIQDIKQGQAGAGLNPENNPEISQGVKEFINPNSTLTGKEI